MTRAPGEDVAGRREGKAIRELGPLAGQHEAGFSLEVREGLVRLCHRRVPFCVERTRSSSVQVVLFSKAPHIEVVSRGEGGGVELGKVRVVDTSLELFEQDEGITVESSARSRDGRDVRGEGFTIEEVGVRDIGDEPVKTLLVGGDIAGRFISIDEEKRVIDNGISLMIGVVKGTALGEISREFDGRLIEGEGRDQLKVLCPVALEENVLDFFVFFLLVVLGH
mmetsp:Transcript_26829/g.44924  ORF Transcript_26829/g.44924 Transcript_26829/m.44924 type:complete len:223 (+) Transcript_26829:1-669(+)